MIAKVLLLRRMGVLTQGTLPPSSEWPLGRLEFVRGDSSGPRRLVLRMNGSAPDRGVIVELIRPELVDVAGPRLRLRGIETVPLGGLDRGAMVQEWLVEMRS